MKKAVNDFTVLENKALNPTNYLIRLKSPQPLPAFFPGQFVNVEIKKEENVFLRRPFSVFEVNYELSELSLIVKILGKGSLVLTTVEAGDTISLVYPLGKSFSKPEESDRILLIGGGSGVAPMLFLAKTSGLPAKQVEVILGARSSDDIINLPQYSRYGNLNYTTEDGSFGTKGFVTNHPLFAGQLHSFDKIYTCGPEPMMKAVAQKAQKEGIFCEVSLENLMACGFGVCLCCIEPTDKGNLCVCTEGPVFNINSLKWQI